jgi:hypothetical protein
MVLPEDFDGRASPASIRRPSEVRRLADRADEDGPVQSIDPELAGLELVEFSNRE